MDEQTYRFSWDIKNFSFVPNFIYSKCLCVEILDHTHFIAILSFRAIGDRDFFTFYIKRCHEIGPDSIGLRATFHLIAADGTPGNEITLSKDITKTGTFAFRKFASRSDVERFYLRNDTLKIQCVLRKINKELTTQTLIVRTSGNVQKIYKEWHLTNFSQVRGGKVLESIRLREGGDLLFDVCLFIEGRPGQKMVIIQFNRRSDPSGIPLSLNTLITVLDAQGIDSDIWKQDQHVFHMRTTEEVWQFPTFITKALLLRQKNKYLAKNILNLKCEITLCPGTMTSKIDSSSFSEEISGTQSVDKLTEDMKDLYNSKRFADVKLRVFGETVPVHRIILQSRSKEFAKMLDDVVRPHNDVLDIPDVALIPLKRMLQYMYSDEIDGLEHGDSVEAYTSAHKYRIESLKCKYSFVLQSNLKVSNVCRILILADDFCDHNLKNCAETFIKKYWNRVGLSEDWEELAKERQLLAAKTKEQIRQMYAVKHCTIYS